MAACSHAGIIYAHNKLISMKHSVLLLIVLLFSISGYAQNDTARLEQYAEIVATPRLLSNKVTISIDYGEERSIWKDSRLKNDEGKAVKFNTVIDALNYMGREGWKLVNAFPINKGSEQVYHYVFKKSFSKSETAER